MIHTDPPVKSACSLDARPPDLQHYFGHSRVEKEGDSDAVQADRGEGSVRRQRARRDLQAKDVEPSERRGGKRMASKSGRGDWAGKRLAMVDES